MKNRRSSMTSSSSDPTGYDRLSDDVADLVDQMCDEFENCWRRGQPQPIEELIAHASTAARQVLFHELLLIEIPYRLRAGEPLSVEQYHQRFPQVDRSWITDAIVSAIDGNHPVPTFASGHLPLPAIPGYEILEEIGRGSMGVVYRAIQQGLGRVVAIKTLPRFSQNLSELTARFRSEAEAVARLQHVGIIQIHEVGFQNGIPFFSMEYIAGGSLGELLKQRPLHPRVAAKLVVQLAEAIHYAHQQGIVHRDLKPENVLLQQSSLVQRGVQDPSRTDLDLKLRSLLFDPDDTRITTWSPKITDFGLAKQVDSTSNITVDGTLLGTPSYMAPEQTGLSDVPISRACDIYGLGAILYSALVGRPPFHAATVVDTVQLVRNAEPTPPSRIQPAVPKDLETICLKCLSKKPEQRFSSAQDLAEDLNRFLSNQPIRSRSISTLTRMCLWRQRNRAVANMLIALGATLILGICGISWMWVRAERSALLLTRERDTVAIERMRAQQHLDRSRDAIDGMVTIGELLLRTPGREKEGRDALQRLIEYCEGFIDDDSKDPIVRHQTAVAFLRLGRVNTLLGLSQQADLALHRSRGLLSLLKEEFPEEKKYSVGLAYSLSDHANLLRSMARSSESESTYRLAIQEWEQIIANGDSSGKRKLSLANALANFALIKNPLKDGPELKERLLYGIQLVEEALLDNEMKRDWKVDYVIQLEALANLHLSLEEYSESEKVLERVMAVWQDINPAKGESHALYRLALTHMLRAKLFSKLNRRELGASAYREAIAILSDLSNSTISLQMYRVSLLDALQALSAVLDSDSDKGEIKRLKRHACQVAAMVDNQADATNVQTRLRHANTLLNCVVVLDPESDLQEIENCFETALNKIREAFELEPDNPRVLLEKALAVDDYGMYQFRNRNFEMAESLVLQAREIRDQVASKSSGPGDIDYYRARSRSHLSLLYRDTQRLEQALQSTMEAIELLSPLVEHAPNQIAYRVLLMEQRLSSVGLLRAVGKSESAWRSKLAAYLDHNSILRLPNSPSISNEYVLFPLQLAKESRKYPGASEELAEELLSDIDEFEHLIEDHEHLRNAQKIAEIYRMTSSALIALDVTRPILRLEERALKLDPDNLECANGLAWWLVSSPILAERNPQKALELAERLVKLNPDDANYRNTLALIYVRLENWEAAQEQVKRVQTLRKDDWFDAVIVAMIGIQKNDPEPARKLLEKARDSSDAFAPETVHVKVFLSEIESMLRSPKKTK